VQQVVNENETGYLRGSKQKLIALEKYDVVFIGFRIWDMKMPPLMNYFRRMNY